MGENESKVAERKSVVQSRGKSQTLQFPRYTEAILNCSSPFPSIYFQPEKSFVCVLKLFVAA